MALKACRECRKAVSTRASACPQCGCPVRRRTSPAAWGCLILIAGFFSLIVCSGIMTGPNVTQRRTPSPLEPSSSTKPKAEKTDSRTNAIGAASSVPAPMATSDAKAVDRVTYPDAASSEPNADIDFRMSQAERFPSPKELVAAATKAGLTTDIPWGRSRTGSDFLAIFRNFNGASGIYVSSSQMSGRSTMEYNEVNCMLEGPTQDRVDKVTVEAECYNRAQAHLHDTLRIFVTVLKEIDTDLPANAIERFGAAMERPQMIGKWKVQAKMHQAGADIVATMQR